MPWLVLLLTVALETQAGPQVQSSAATAPDAYWCPMHPNVRSAVEGTCPICRMTLSRMPSPRVGEYRLMITQRPAASGRGLSGLRVSISEHDQGLPLTLAFVTMHDRPLHLFIVNRSLEYFAHVHPEQMPDGSFELRHAIPPGEYMIVADFLPVGGAPQTVQRAMVTPGYDPRGRSRAPAPPASGRGSVVTVDGVNVTIDAHDLVAGKTTPLRFAVTDVKTGAPVTDLEPYLSAPAHALLVSADLTYTVHGHPNELVAGGPGVSFDLLVPIPGAYKVWLQVQRRGRVITLPFELQVR